MQIPIIRWPKPVVQRSLKISHFLHFLLCRRCGPLRPPFASVFGNSLLQFLFPTPFCNLNLQFLLQLLSAIPLQLPLCDETRIQGKRTIRGNDTRGQCKGTVLGPQLKGTILGLQAKETTLRSKPTENRRNQIQDRIQGDNIKTTIQGDNTRTAIQGDNPRGQYKGQYKVPSQGENRRTQTKGTIRGPKPRGQ